MHSNRGFTLIELLTVISILGVLIALSLSGFTTYKANAAYSVAESTFRNARSALEAGLNNTDNPPVSVPLTRQASAGAIMDARLAQLLPGMQIPKSLSMQASYDASCEDSSCVSEFMQFNHCSGKEFVRWMRFGDGIDILADHISGSGCP